MHPTPNISALLELFPVQPSSGMSFGKRVLLLESKVAMMNLFAGQEGRRRHRE